MNQIKFREDPHSLTPLLTKEVSKEEGPCLPIKIFGLQRSGTNYLSYLVSQNFQNVKILVNSGGWKHGHYCPWAFPTECHVLVLIKNPYAWLASVYNYWRPPKKLNIGPNLENVSFEDFVKSKAVFELQKGVPYLIRASNPVQYWNNMNYHWCSIKLKECKLCIVVYDWLIRDTISTIVEIGRSFDLTPKPQDIIDFKHDFIPAGEVIIPAKEEWTNREWYFKKEYMNMYSPELIKFVNSELDSEIMNTLKYDYEGQ